MFLGVAVGILVTVVVAAVAAIVLVLVRNTKQKRNLSELAHYNNLNTSTINSSIQSSLTSKHCIAGVVVNQYKDEDILNYVIFNRNNHLEQDRVAGKEMNCNQFLPSSAQAQLGAVIALISSNTPTHPHPPGRRQI